MTTRRLFHVLVATGLGVGLVGVVWHVSATQPTPGTKTPDAQPKNKDAKLAEDRVKVGDVLEIRGAGLLPEEPIHGLYQVEASGALPLGLNYGRVRVAGLTLEETEAAIVKHLMRAQKLKTPQISVRRPIPTNPQLERRVEELEREVRELKTAIEELKKKK